MADSASPESPLDAAAGAAGPHTIDALEQLASETRLAILLALWEAYTPYEDDNAIPFSELRDRVGVRDSGQFNYHLGKLVGGYIAETDDGYVLRHQGRKIVQAVVAGTGLTRQAISPTAVEIACTHCGGPTEISYDDGMLYHACTECGGYFGGAYSGDNPAGTIAYWPLDPAGLADRSPAEIYAAAHINTVTSITGFTRGVCPTCSGAIGESLQVCDAHEVEPGGVCPACGTREEVRVQWICSVCKASGAYSIGSAVYEQPVVQAFLYDQGIDLQEHITDPESAVRVMEYAREIEHELVSDDPLRVRVVFPGSDANLQLTLDDGLDVKEVERQAREPG